MKRTLLRFFTSRRLIIIVTVVALIFTCHQILMLIIRQEMTHLIDEFKSPTQIADPGFLLTPSGKIDNQASTSKPNTKSTRVRISKKDSPVVVPPDIDDSVQPIDDIPTSPHAIFGFMPLKDQQFMMGIISRFSLGELNVIYKAYQTGGEEWAASKEIVISRVTESEIERAKSLYYQYIN